MNRIDPVANRLQGVPNNMTLALKTWMRHYQMKAT